MLYAGPTVLSTCEADDLWCFQRSKELSSTVISAFLLPPQFHLSYSDKELLDREDRGESQQEILRRVAKDLPIYTRTMSGGTLASSHTCPRTRDGAFGHPQLSFRAVAFPLRRGCVSKSKSRTVYDVYIAPL